MCPPCGRFLAAIDEAFQEHARESSPNIANRGWSFRPGPHAEPDSCPPAMTILRQIDAKTATGIGDRLRRLQSAPSDKHGEPPEQSPLGLIQEIVTQSMVLRSVCCRSGGRGAPPVNSCRRLCGRSVSRRAAVAGFRAAAVRWPAAVHPGVNRFPGPQLCFRR